MREGVLCTDLQVAPLVQAYIQLDERFGHPGGVPSASQRFSRHGRRPEPPELRELTKLRELTELTELRELTELTELSDSLARDPVRYMR
jgi:hypothetical protein